MTPRPIEAIGYLAALDEGDTRMKPTDFELVYRAMKVFNGFDAHSDHLWWRTDYEGEQVKLLVQCNDVFMWGCSDCEELNHENIDTLEKAYADLLALPGEEAWNVSELFVARVRGMRPQGAWYKYIERPQEIALFNACGPEREPGFGNPDAAPVTP